MLFKINSLKTNFSPIKIILFVALLTCGFIIYQFINENRFSENENALYHNLIEELVKQKICTNNPTCPETIHLYRKSGNRIYFNMYHQSDMTIAASVGQFLVRDGIKLSKGMPITLTVYSGSKPDNEAPLLKLEIEK